MRERTWVGLAELSLNPVNKIKPAFCALNTGPGWPDCVLSQVCPWTLFTRTAH